MTSPSTNNGDIPRSPRRSALMLGVLAVLSALGVVGFTSLGIWQLKRRTWKLELIDQVDRRIHAAPVLIPPPDAWAKINAKDDAYRHLTVEGGFLQGHSMLVRAVTERGAGFWVLTPLRTDRDVTVLVNRGFVPGDRRDQVMRGELTPHGKVRVTGLMRMTEPKGGFLRRNRPEMNRWYSRDVAAIATAQGLSHVAPFFIDADATSNPGGLPVGGLTVVTFRNNHLVYALTWFALALMLAGGSLSVVRHEYCLRREDRNRGSRFLSRYICGKRQSLGAPGHRC